MERCLCVWCGKAIQYLTVEAGKPFFMQHEEGFSRISMGKAFLQCWKDATDGRRVTVHSEQREWMFVRNLFFRSGCKQINILFLRLLLSLIIARSRSDHLVTSIGYPSHATAPVAFERNLLVLLPSRFSIPPLLCHCLLFTSIVSWPQVKKPSAYYAVISAPPLARLQYLC